MKDKSNIIIIIIAIVVIGFIALGAMNKGNEFKDISKYVEDNKQELETIKDAYLNGNTADLPKEVESVKVIKSGNDTLVYFKMKDKGNKKTNLGFYYSKINRPSALEEKEIDIIELGGEKYKWTEDNTAGITNKIEDNWYFYKKTK